MPNDRVVNKEQPITGICLCELIKFTSGVPEVYQSSNIAKRGFCSECGSPILFSYKTLDAVFVGNLDDLEYWQPNGCHLGIESQISWETIFDDPPRYCTEDDPTFIEANSK